MERSSQERRGRSEEQSHYECERQSVAGQAGPETAEIGRGIWGKGMADDEVEAGRSCRGKSSRRARVLRGGRTGGGAATE